MTDNLDEIQHDTSAFDDVKPSWIWLPFQNHRSQECFNKTATLSTTTKTQDEDENKDENMNIYMKQSKLYEKAIALLKPLHLRAK